MKASSGSPAAVLSRSKMKAMNATAALEMSALKRKKARSDRGVNVAPASKVADLAYKRILRGGPCPAAARDTFFPSRNGFCHQATHSISRADAPSRLGNVDEEGGGQ